MTDFLRMIAVTYGSSVMWGESVDKRLVSMEAKDLSLAQVMDALSRRFGVQVAQASGGWFVGELRHEDTATLVRKTARLKASDVEVALQGIISATGRAKCFADGLLVVVDKPDGVRRAAAVLDSIESAPADTWVCQLYLFSTSRTASKELGIDTSALLDLSYAFAKSSLASTPDDGFKLAGSLSAVMRATATREDVELVGKPLFLLADGEKATFTSGITVPVPKRTTSPEGTTRTESFEYVQSGLTAEVYIRDGGRGTARLEVKCTLGQITGFVESAPIQARDEFSTSAVIGASGVYLIGALDRDENRQGGTGLFEKALLKRTSEKRQSQIQVWARLYKIGGAVK